MSEMVERVKAAIGPVIAKWAQPVGPTGLDEIARAAMATMRDCDVGSARVLLAGKHALFSCSEDPELEDARGCWQAMIDAALSPQPGCPVSTPGGS